MRASRFLTQNERQGLALPLGVTPKQKEPGSGLAWVPGLAGKDSLP
jgi:hypothetical protein